MQPLQMTWVVCDFYRPDLARSVNPAAVAIEPHPVSGCSEWRWVAPARSVVPAPGAQVVKR